MLFQVKVAFQTTTSLLSEIAEDYLNNTEVPAAGRKVEILDNLTVEFNNGAVQVSKFPLPVRCLFWTSTAEK